MPQRPKTNTRKDQSSGDDDVLALLSPENRALLALDFLEDTR